MVPSPDLKKHLIKFKDNDCTFCTQETKQKVRQKNFKLIQIATTFDNKNMNCL